MARFQPPGECPVCGEFVPARATVCRGCGSCEKTGWNDDADYDGLDLPDEAFENGDQATRTESRFMRRIWWLAGIVLLLISLWYIIIRMP